MFFNNKKVKTESPTGINRVGMPIYERGSKLWGLLSRGVSIFLVLCGSIGCFTSSFGITYKEILVVPLLLVFCLYLGFIFYNGWSKNLGYILYFIFFLMGIVLFIDIVNSGFYAMLNIVLEKIEILMNLPTVTTYGERNTNRYITITICLIFVGMGFGAMLNSLISNSMSVIRTIVYTFPVVLIGAYFNLLPSLGYFVMLITGYVIIYVMKRSNHYKSNKKDEDFKVIDTKKGTNIVYHSDGKIMLQMGVFVFVLVAVIFVVTKAAFPNGNIKTPLSWDKYRSETDNVIAEFALYGWEGFFDQNSASGGISGGELGGVNMIKNDYETDLIVEMTPYSTSPLYLRAYIGVTYDTDRWTTITESDRLYTLVDQESNLLKQTYEDENETAAKGKISIENIDADVDYFYAPYYITNKGEENVWANKLGIVEGESEIGETYIMDYYPYNDQAKLEKNIEVSKEYLDVPEINEVVIDEFCKQAGFGGSDEEIIAQVTQYFQNNIPYTLRPGSLPEGEDYVNYFLMENRKGYCAHFASAATLIFRHYGIPARYVEGYSVSYDTFLNGDLVKNEKYEDWYEGYSQLGETSLVRVEVNDSMAHAWVEVYDDDFGWRPVEVTPSSSEGEVYDFWSMFTTGFGNNDLNLNVGNNKISLGRFTYILIFISIVSTLYILYRVIVMVSVMIRRSRSFHTLDYNENLVNRYMYMCKILRKKHKEFVVQVNHEKQIEWIVEKYGIEDINIKAIACIMDKASYSKEVIYKEDYDNVNFIIKKIVKKARFFMDVKSRK